MFTPANQIYKIACDSVDDYIKQNIDTLREKIESLLQTEASRGIFEVIIKFTARDTPEYSTNKFIIGSTPSRHQDVLLAIIKPELVAAGYNVCFNINVFP
jgi:hypothetical protein